MASIPIYVSDGTTTSPYFLFYTDAAGTEELTPTNTLYLNQSYTFSRLTTDSATNPFYISDTSYNTVSTGAIDLSGNEDYDSGITFAQSFTLTFITLSESDTLYYYCPAINSTISSTFTLIQPPTPCAVFNKTVEFNDAVSISGELTLTGDVITTGTFSGSGASLTSIPNTALDNSMITINGSSVALGDSMTIVASQWTTDASDIYYLDGNVGIGTTDPSFSLDVSGSINCNTLLVDGAAPSFGGDYVKIDVSYSTSSQTYLDVSASTSSSSVSTVWTQDASYNIYYSLGHVGIGTTDPSYALDVSGDVRISGTFSGSGGNLTNIPNTALDNSMVTINGTSVALGDSMTIVASQWTTDVSDIYYLDGNVSIGTTDPSYALDVSGDVRIGGDLMVGGGTINSSVTYDVSVNANNKFVIDGEDVPELTMMRGFIYNFDQTNSTNSSHPIGFTTADTDGNTAYAGVSYTSGVSTDGSMTTFIVPQDAPDQLYYVCQNHAGMGNAINVVHLAQAGSSGSSSGGGVWTQDASGDISYGDGDVFIDGELELSGNLNVLGDISGYIHKDNGTYALMSLVVGSSSSSSSSSAGVWTQDASDNISYSLGNVGIGTTDPSYALDVSGEVQIVGGVDVSGYLKVPFGSDDVSSTAFAGYIRYNDVSNEFQGYDASENVWSSLGSGSSTDTAASVSLIASGHSSENSYTVSSTDYTAYQFVQDGTFTVNTDVYADILIVGGGGAGGVGSGSSSINGNLLVNGTSYGIGGGGGGGQVLAVSNISLVANQSYSVIVGAGGINQGAINDGLSGELSSFGTYEALGGGGGGGASGASDYTPADSVAGYNSGGGGSGFAGAYYWDKTTNVGSAGTPSSGGNSGGGGSYGGNYATSGGGGGAGGVGGAGGDSGSSTTGGDGGIGMLNTYWDGSDNYYGGGGGGCSVLNSTGVTTASSGGSSGGGAGFVSGTSNTGGGGGGTDDSNLSVGYGGSGVVIIRINLTSQGIATTSDDRLKHNEEDISGLELITQLHPQKYLKTRLMYEENYTLTVDASGNYTNLLEGDSVHEEMGVIAQDILKIPELNFCVVNTTPYSLKYDNLFVLSIQAIKELKAEKDALQTSHDTLQTELTELKALLQSKGLLD